MICRRVLHAIPTYRSEAAAFLHANRTHCTDSPLVYAWRSAAATTPAGCQVAATEGGKTPKCSGLRLERVFETHVTGGVAKGKKTTHTSERLRSTAVPGGGRVVDSSGTRKDMHVRYPDAVSNSLIARRTERTHRHDNRCASAASRQTDLEPWSCYFNGGAGGGVDRFDRASSFRRHWRAGRKRHESLTGAPPGSHVGIEQLPFSLRTCSLACELYFCSLS